MDNGRKTVKAAIYARCSTDESRQDVATQLSELRRYCEACGWAYGEHEDLRFEPFLPAIAER